MGVNVMDVPRDTSLRVAALMVAASTGARPQRPARLGHSSWLRGSLLAHKGAPVRTIPLLSRTEGGGLGGGGGGLHRRLPPVVQGK